jgi:surfeit locus 1 family protein
LLLPGVIALVTFAILLGLGFWQLQRLAWKDDLIVTLDRRTNALPAPLPQPKDWAQLSPDADEFSRVTVTVQFLDRPHAHVFTSGSALRQDIKAPGYFVFVPARLASGEIVVVDAGYVSERTYPWIGGKMEIVGYLRWPEKPSWLVSAHDAAGTLWFVRDHRAMARELGWGEHVAPFYIDQEAPVPAGGSPRPGPLAVKLRNDHLGYAITWFGLAAVLLVVFAFWAVRGEREVSASRPRSP